MKKKKSLIAVILALILVLSFSISSFAAVPLPVNAEGPSAMFTGLMEKFFSDPDKYCILDDNTDVTEQFYQTYEDDYEQGNIKNIWDDFMGTYCISWTENESPMTRASQLTPYRLFYYLDQYEASGIEFTCRLDASYTVNNGQITNWNNPSFSVHHVGGTGTFVSANPTQISTAASVSYDRTQITHSARFTLVVSVFTLAGTKTYSFPHTASFVTDETGVYIGETQS